MTTPSVAAPRRSVAGRALLAVLLLLGFYVLGLSIIGALVALDVWLITNNHSSLRALIVTGVVGYALLRGMFFVERRSTADEVTGIAVTEQEQPRLWALVRDIARRLGTDPPARIYLTPDVNAFVFQRSRFLGLVPGERVMGVGMPLLHVLSLDELRGVLAHEFGHYTGGDTRLGPLVYRGRASIGRTLGHLGEDSWVGKLIEAYGKLYLRVSQAVSRRQELDADANAAARVGPEAHASALRRIHVAGPVFDTFVGRYVRPLWAVRARPRDLYAGFRTFHDHPDHVAAREKVAARMAAEEGDKYDSHPPLGVRLAALGDVAAAADDAPREPSHTVLDDAGALDERMTALVSQLASDGMGLRVVEWDGGAAEAMLAPVVKDDTDRLLRGVLRVLGRYGTVADALDLVQAGRTVELAAAITPDLADVPEADRARVGADVVADALAGAVAQALTTERGWRWGLRWNGPANLVAPSGEGWEYGTVVYQAVRDPALLPALRDRLREQGLAA